MSISLWELQQNNEEEHVVEAIWDSTQEAWEVSEAS
jgi:hypothetical protein